MYIPEFAPYLKKSGIINPIKIAKLGWSPEIEKLFKHYFWCSTPQELNHCVMNGVQTQPLCPSCNKPTKFYNNTSTYGKFCSNLCIGKSKETQQRKGELSKQRYANQLDKLKIKFPWISSVCEGLYCERKNILTQPTCPICNKLIRFLNTISYPTTCGYICSIKYRNQTNGDTIEKKRKATNLKKYGTEYYINSQAHKDRKNEFDEKRKITNLKKYGTESSQQKHWSPDTVKQLNDRAFLFDLHVNQKIPMYVIAEQLGVTACTVANYFEKLHIPINELLATSYYEKDVADYIKQISANELIETNQRGLLSFNREIDILVNRNFGIEIDSLYWHSYNTKETQHQIFKHQTKKFECQLSKICLFQIWDYEWKRARTKQIWKSKIALKLGVTNLITKHFARNLIVKEILDTKLVRAFVDENHIQGSTKGIGIAYGLFDSMGELISVMTMGKPRYNTSYEFELLRFCCKKYHHVVGGASKLLKHFERTHHPKSIISYANLRFSEGDVYLQLGFDYVRPTRPNYLYIDKSATKRLSRHACQKHKLKTLLTNFDDNLSEAQNMFNNGYKRVWDSGNLVFEKKY